MLEFIYLFTCLFVYPLSILFISKKDLISLVKKALENKKEKEKKKKSQRSSSSAQLPPPPAAQHSLPPSHGLDSPPRPSLLRPKLSSGCADSPLTFADNIGPHVSDSPASSFFFRASLSRTRCKPPTKSRFPRDFLLQRVTEPYKVPSIVSRMSLSVSTTKFEP